MTRKIRILFRWTPHNHYTIAALIGLLDEALEAPVFSVDTVETPEQITAEALSGVNALTILAYSFTTPHFAEAKKEISLLKSALGGKILIMCGGPHVTALPESALEAGADICFTGECEESLPSFLKKLASDGPNGPDRIIRPLPLKDFEDYPPFAYKRDLFSPIEIRRGCAVGCSFCQTPRMFGGIKERGAGYVMRYARMLKKNGRGIVLFTIPDALSYGSSGGGVNMAFLKSFLEGLSAEGMKAILGTFPSEASPRRLARFPEAAELLRKHVANTKVALGGQSGSRKVLEAMGRDHSVEDINVSAAVLAKNGFTPIIDMLFGTPGETRHDRLDSLRLMKALFGAHKARFNLHYFMSLPGTPFAGKKPEIIEDDIKEDISGFLRSGVAVGDFFEQMGFSG